LPLKIIFFISVLWIVGGGLGIWLLGKVIRSFCGLSSRAKRGDLTERQVFAGDGHVTSLLAMTLLYCLAVYALCYIYLPCFDFSGSIICHGDKKRNEIALTFDDGPQEPYTSQILDILKKEEVHATFFVLGKYVEKNRDLIRRIIQEGHVVGNHGFSHIPLAFQNSDFIRHEIENWERVMNPMGVLPYKIFRASHGWKNPWLVSFLHQKGYRFIGWDVGIWDSDKPGTEILLQRLKKNVSSGSIILLHDGDGDHEGGDRSQTVSVLPEMIHFYKQQGYRFVTIPEMLLK